MKKALLLVVILSSTITNIFAQYYYNNSNSNNNNAPALKLGIGITTGATVGAASTAFPEAGGISLKLELPVNKSPLSVLITTGYTFYVSQSGYDIGYDYYGYEGGTYYSGDVASFIPIEAGLKLYLINKFFIEGQAGVSFNVNSYASDYTGKATAFIYTPGAGYTFPLGYSGKYSLDVGLVYENRVEPGGGYSQIAAKAVWNFSL